MANCSYIQNALNDFLGNEKSSLAVEAKNANEQHRNITENDSLISDSEVTCDEIKGTVEEG